MLELQLLKTSPNSFVVNLLPWSQNSQMRLHPRSSVETSNLTSFCSSARKLKPSKTPLLHSPLLPRTSKEKYCLCTLTSMLRTTNVFLSSLPSNLKPAQLYVSSNWKET